MKQSLKIYLSFTFLVLIIATFSINQETLSITNNEQFYIEHYSDADENGNSIATLQSTNPVSYSYQINKSVQFPYAGIYFEDTLNARKINLSNYNQVTISIKAKKGRKIPITINTIWNLKNRPYQKLLNVSPKTTIFTVPLSEFKTPDWWLNKNKVVDDNFQTFKKIRTINIENCKLLQPGLTDEVEVSHIIFSHKNLYSYIILCSVWLSGVFTIFIIFNFKKNKKLVPIKSVDYEPKEHQDSKTLVTSYIGNNYTNPNLSIQDISIETNVKSSEVSKILTLHYSTTFKEYLNYVRISEAKKLLKESDLNISEIAYSVGYNNVTHFNRVFKAQENISPNEFRSN
tara:strand:- start:734 stop:1765 length:1032 start_codon:yes stop_codon:yes gene_type:complete